MPHNSSMLPLIISSDPDDAHNLLPSIELLGLEAACQCCWASPSDGQKITSQLGWAGELQELLLNTTSLKTVPTMQDLGHGLPRPLYVQDHDSHRGVTQIVEPDTSGRENHCKSDVSHAGNIHSRGSSKAEPFYKAYASAKQRTSPLVKTEQPWQQPAATQEPCNEDAIAPHLQIPTTVNNSGRSLAELAAQITCLFWFESLSDRMLLVDDLGWPLPEWRYPFVPDATPTTGFLKWVTTILSMTQVSQNVVLLALLFIHRLKKLNPAVKGKTGSEYRLLTIALMLGNKFLDDNTYTNKTWADVSGIAVSEIHVMEVEFLSNMRYSLYASKKEWADWHFKLARFSIYYSETPEVTSAPSFPGIPRPGRPPWPKTPDWVPPPPNPPQVYHSTLQSPHPLSMPSPTRAATSTAPAYPTHNNRSISISRNQSPDDGSFEPQTPHSLSMAPPLYTTTSTAPAFVPSKPLSSSGPRKRSLEDGSFERPLKKMASQSSESSSTLSNSSLPASIHKGPAVTGTSSAPSMSFHSPWRLPPPNNSNGGTVGAQTTTGHSASHQARERAMAMVYPSQNKPSRQVQQLPSLQMANPYLATAFNPQGLSGPQLSLPAYMSLGQNPSPTSYNFPHLQTPDGLSPSGWVGPRNSPYKPIRGVNTLLVAPPSAAMQQAPEQLSYDQMRYQPLGRPSSERRTGVLPLLPFNTWSDSARPMAPHLPPPPPISS